MVRGPHFKNHWSGVIFGRYFIQIRAKRPTLLREFRQSANAETVSHTTITTLLHILPIQDSPLIVQFDTTPTFGTTNSVVQQITHQYKSKGL